MVTPLPQMTATPAIRHRPGTAHFARADAYGVILALSMRRLAKPYAVYGASLVIPFVGSLPCRGQKSTRWYAEQAGDNRPGFLMAVATRILASIKRPAKIDLFLPGRLYGESFENEPGSQPIPRAIRIAYEAEMRGIELHIDVLDTKATPRLAQLQRLLDQTPEDKVFEDDAFQLFKIDLSGYSDILAAGEQIAKKPD